MKTTTATMALLALTACAAPPRLQPTLRRGCAACRARRCPPPTGLHPDGGSATTIRCSQDWWSARWLARPASLRPAPAWQAPASRCGWPVPQQGAQVQLNAQFDQLDPPRRPVHRIGFGFVQPGGPRARGELPARLVGQATGEPGCRAGSRPRCHGRAAGRRGGAVGGSDHRIFRMAGRCGAHRSGARPAPT